MRIRSEELQTIVPKTHMTRVYVNTKFQRIYMQQNPSHVVKNMEFRGQFLELFSTAWVNNYNDLVEETSHVVDIVPQNTTQEREKGQRRVREAMPTPMNLPTNDVDEANLTWHIGQAVGMHTDDPGLVIRTLRRRSQRKGQQLNT